MPCRHRGRALPALAAKRIVIGIHRGLYLGDPGYAARPVSVFYSMSRDGLLPKEFSDIHPKFQTPYRCNLIFMVFVSLFSGFLPISKLGHMTSIGTRSPS